VELRCNAAQQKRDSHAVAFFFVFFCYIVLQCSKESDSSYRSLLLPLVELRCSATQRKRRRQLPSPSSSSYGITLQHNAAKKATATSSPFSSSYGVALCCSATKKVMAATVTFFFFFFFLQHKKARIR
jgi:hypothetical protein